MGFDEFYFRCDWCGQECSYPRGESLNGYVFVLCGPRCQFDLVVALTDWEDVEYSEGAA